MKRLMNFIRIITFVAAFILVILKFVFRFNISVAALILIFTVAISMIPLMNMKRIGS